MSFAEDMIWAADAYGIELTGRQQEQFLLYFQLLVEWNEKMNLTAITEPREVAVKHMIDSLSAYDADCFPQDASVIDVGTGAGFPGIPLRILRPDLQLTLLDSLNKRVRFLQTVVDALELTGTACIHARAEEAAHMRLYREQFDVACARAVARLPILTEYCLPFVRPGGVFIALKGRQYAAEVQESAKAVKMLGGNLLDVRPVHLPGLDDSRAVIRVKKIKKTPRAYPRKAGTPEKMPL